MAYIAIVGAAGYSGQETLDRVLRHPHLELAALGSDSLAGSPASALDPRLSGGVADIPDLVTNETALQSGADLVFISLDHRRAAAVEPPEHGVMVDLSGAHRLHDAAGYDRWYGFTHPFPDGLDDWSYALADLAPPNSRLVANPGCYAAATLLALLPLVDAIDLGSVVIDAKSGVSGAGRSPTPATHANTVLENLAAYRIGDHQHAAEIGQALGHPVTFVPHLLPIRRGLLATCYVTPAAPDLRGRLEAAYEKSTTVRLLDPGLVPDLSRVRGTDCAEVGLFEDQFTDRAIIVCAIDNLGKGAAGQAVQNANLVLGYPETAGLRLQGVAV